MGEFRLILCLALLVQQVSFAIKEISSHLDIIFPLKSAYKVKLYSLRRWGKMQPGKKVLLCCVIA